MQNRKKDTLTLLVHPQNLLCALLRMGLNKPLLWGWVEPNWTPDETLRRQPAFLEQQVVTILNMFLFQTVVLKVIQI